MKKLLLPLFLVATLISVEGQSNNNYMLFGDSMAQVIQVATIKFQSGELSNLNSISIADLKKDVEFPVKAEDSTIEDIYSGLVSSESDSSVVWAHSSFSEFSKNALRSLSDSFNVDTTAYNNFLYRKVNQIQDESNIPVTEKVNLLKMYATVFNLINNQTQYSYTYSHIKHNKRRVPEFCDGLGHWQCGLIYGVFGAIVGGIIGEANDDLGVGVLIGFAIGFVIGFVGSFS